MEGIVKTSCCGGAAIRGSTDMHAQLIGRSEKGPIVHQIYGVLGGEVSDGLGHFAVVSVEVLTSKKKGHRHTLPPWFAKICAINFG